MRLFATLSLLLLFGCSSSSVEDRSYVSTSEGDVWLCYIQDGKNLDEMKDFGEKWANPMSELVTFYFYTTNKVPNVDNATTFSQANEIAKSGKPVAMWCKYPNGKSALIELGL